MRKLVALIIIAIALLSSSYAAAQATNKWAGDSTYSMIMPVAVAWRDPNTNPTVSDDLQSNGSGLDDFTSGGTSTDSVLTHYCVKIDLAAGTDTFSWGSVAAGAAENCTNGATGVAMTGAAQTLQNGVTVLFAATTGHTLADAFSFLAGSADVTVWDMDDFVAFKGTTRVYASSFFAYIAAGSGVTCTVQAWKRDGTTARYRSVVANAGMGASAEYEHVTRGPEDIFFQVTACAGGTISVAAPVTLYAGER